MRILASPQWSFGRDRALLHEFEEILQLFRLDIHYLQSEHDHNRTVSTFSGDAVSVFEAMERLCVAALPRIDLQRHMGVFPRIGALDVAPFVPLGEVVPQVLHRYIDQLSWTLADFYQVPVFLYERSERLRAEDELARMRKGGFGTLLGRKLRPDFGPSQVHPHLGVVVLGWRDFVLTINIDLRTEDAGVARALASQMRQLRSEGDERFLGVHGLAMALPSQERSQLHLNLTLPDLTPADPIVDWARVEASRYGTVLQGAHLVGAMRKRDIAGATRLRFRAEQVVGEW